ncbi:MAG: hypothetical protein M1819_000562 [Sarea resinae]|nr:MAG: hypothetical protein M1819_000562 [Sarea resinae]
MTIAIGPGMRAALMETLEAIAHLMPDALKRECFLLGGIAMLTIGGDRHTEDVDIAISPEALHAFHNSVAQDGRFSPDGGGGWIFKCTSNAAADISVGVEFLHIGTDIVPTIKSAEPALHGIMRPGLAELLMMKAYAVRDRMENRDVEDLQLVLEKMVQTGQTLDQIALPEEIDLLQSSVARLGRAYLVLLDMLLV